MQYVLVRNYIQFLYFHSNLLFCILNKVAQELIQHNNKLKSKGIILRSTEEGYKIKNMLRLSIGSAKDNLRFMSAVKSIFNK